MTTAVPPPPLLVPLSTHFAPPAPAPLGYCLLSTEAAAQQPCFPEVQAARMFPPQGKCATFSHFCEMRLLRLLSNSRKQDGCMYYYVEVAVALLHSTRNGGIAGSRIVGDY